LIWECEIRPAVAGRAYARNLRKEKDGGEDWLLGIGERIAHAKVAKGGGGGAPEDAVPRSWGKIFANEVIEISLK